MGFQKTVIKVVDEILVTRRVSDEKARENTVRRLTYSEVKDSR